MIIKHKFVDIIPDNLEEGVLYISLKYCTAIHKCVCGCGNEVVTTISPEGWYIKFNGKNISLYPSIGNWNFECKSHYWIIDGKVIWDDSFYYKQKNYGYLKRILQKFSNFFIG